MANRRMFANSIVGSARFLRMPATTRLLYYDLGMDADDDGFVEAFTVIRKTGACEDDLRVLAAKGFVKVVNADLVTLICDWKTNNLIKKDRYSPSIYKNILTEIGSGTVLEPERNQDGTKVEPQYSIGKDRLGKCSIGKGGGWFDKIWNEYPEHRRGDADEAKAAFVKVLFDDQEAQLAYDNLSVWKKSSQWVDDNGQYVPKLENWLLRGHWKNPPSLQIGKDVKTSCTLGAAELEAIQSVLSQPDYEEGLE